MAFGPEDALHGGGVGGGVRAALPAALSSLLALQLSLEQLCAVSRLDRASGRGGHQRGLPEHDALAACLAASPGTNSSFNIWYVDDHAVERLRRDQHHCTCPGTQ